MTLGWLLQKTRTTPQAVGTEAWKNLRTLLDEEVNHELQMTRLTKSVPGAYVVRQVNESGVFRVHDLTDLLLLGRGNIINNFEELLELLAFATRYVYERKVGSTVLAILGLGVFGCSRENDKGSLGGQDAFLHGFRAMRPKQGLACDDRGQLRIRTDESVLHGSVHALSVQRNSL